MREEFKKYLEILAPIILICVLMAGAYLLHKGEYELATKIYISLVERF